MTDKPPSVPATSARADIKAFVGLARSIAVKGPAAGRLILSLDATMSRQPTWDLACHLQAEMFEAAASTGRLDIQLAHFRGIGEFATSRFVGSAAELKEIMGRIACRAGHTQLKRVLDHAQAENRRGRVAALVYIGDAMEENVDTLAESAARLGMLGVPVFLFQEGHDAVAERAFREIARLSKGAWFRFDRNAASALARLLSSIAVFATGGLTALQRRGTREDRLLLSHMQPKPKGPDQR